ncbi:DinB family protein [Povalibacter sp.]|uniref:DinB family protein n=1 Tax=Povalibacter sp. TaxID=1962978 RepID=UPI002F3F4D3C
MSRETAGTLMRQFDLAWKLTSYHLKTLTTDECLWRPAAVGLHVHPDGNSWRADWPEREDYDIGPASIGWITWHLGFWWSMVLNHSNGDGSLTREAVIWPGTADGVRQWLGGLHDDWQELLTQLTDEDLRATQRTRWPMRDRPFGDVVAWANIELSKNAAEIGYARFLYAVRCTANSQCTMDN